MLQVVCKERSKNYSVSQKKITLFGSLKGEKCDQFLGNHIMFLEKTVRTRWLKLLKARHGYDFAEISLISEDPTIKLGSSLTDVSTYFTIKQK